MPRDKPAVPSTCSAVDRTQVHRPDGPPEEPRIRAFRVAAAGLLTTLFACCVYRATTQAITHDEALTWLNYVSGGQAGAPLWQKNNHVLFSHLAIFTTSVFSPSELSLRLPTLLGALLFLGALWRVLRQAGCDGPMLLLAVALVGLNPYVLDYLVAARGYGLGLGLVLAATATLQAGVGPRRTALAGALLGAATAAHLTMLYVSLGLGAVAVLLAARAPPRAGHAAARAAAALLVAFLGVTLVLLLVPMSRARMSDLFLGQTSLLEMSRELSALSLGLPPAEPSRWVDAVALGLVPLIVSAAIVMLVNTLRRGVRGPADRSRMLCSGTLVIAILQLLAARWFLGIPYPAGRLGLTFIVFTSLCCILAICCCRAAARPWRAVGLVSALMMLPLGLRFVQVFRLDYFADVSFDAGSRDLFDALEKHRSGSSVRVAVLSHRHVPALNYYRSVRRADWLEEATR